MPNRLLGYALNASTLQEIRTGTVEKIPKAPLPNATPGETSQLHRRSRGAVKLVGNTQPINLSGIISNPH